MRVCTGTFPLNTKIKFILANESSFIVFDASSIIFYAFFSRDKTGTEKKYILKTDYY